MRRGERITMWVGAALVVGAMVASAVVLVGNGPRPVPPRAEAILVPFDAAWAVFEHCTRPAEGSNDFLGAWMIDLQDGVLHLEVDEADATEAAIAAYEDEVNGCLAGYVIDEVVDDRDAPRIESPAQRLLAYEVATRWLLPCLAGHDALAEGVPRARDYLDDSRVPWHEYYQLAGELELEDVLLARSVCGVGSQPYAL